MFERALRYRESYDRSKGEPVAWLLGIARRCTSAALAARADGGPSRSRKSTDGRSLEEDSVRRLTLAAAFAQLAERDQELIALRFGADLTAAQIARILDARRRTRSRWRFIARSLGCGRSSRRIPKSDAAVRKHLPSLPAVYLFEQANFPWRWVVEELLEP